MLDVSANVNIDFFMLRTSAQNIEGIVYEVHTLFGLSWSVVSVRTEAAS